MPRKPLKSDDGGMYFAASSAVSCISSGCRLLDKVLSGGWREGRTANIVGDKSTGKSLLCIEACANFALKYSAKDGFIRYDEAEAAFDIPYAESIGMPVDRVEFNPDGIPTDTVEEWYDNLEAFMDKVEGVKFTGMGEKAGKPFRKTTPIKGRKPIKAGLYILDSLDALSDGAEKAEAFGKDSFGGKKPKLIGQLFRRIIRRLENLNITLIIVSQTRDKIGVSFGDKLTRSGGKALDFYASQILWLSDLGKIEETKGGVKRKTGTWIRAKCKKNKVGLPWRECDFPIRYSFGLDDFEAGLQWLDEVGGLAKLNFKGETADERKKEMRAYLTYTDGLRVGDTTAFGKECIRFNAAIDSRWLEIEKSFLRPGRKYD